MKKFLQMLCCFFATTQITHAQDWTWMQGSDQINAGPSYGTQGVALPTNTPGGRQLAVTWSDGSGNLWLFGGIGLDGSGLGRLNDLWKYSVATNQWTWMKGDNTMNQPGVYGTMNFSNSQNKPGGRSYAMGWMDTSGNLWLFGGHGCANTTSMGFLSDVWKYTPSTNEWTFMGGDTIINQSGNYGVKTIASANNKPGARIPSNAWTDSNGTFWMFGGEGYNSTGVQIPLSDLWKFNVTTNQWTWMRGDSTGFPPSSYGSLGVSSATNHPGARYGSVSWIDTSDNLWLFSGHGYVGSNPGDLNDLWKYEVATDQWTWMGGDSVLNQLGTYGTKGTSSINNIPGGREETTGWTDKDGNFWLLGGHGYANSGSAFYLNDFWRLNPTTLEWTWMEGDSVTAAYGVYGTLGTISPLNKPGARRHGAAWVTPNNDVWLMGGMGRGAVSSYGYLNDMWKYNLSYLGQNEKEQNVSSIKAYPNPSDGKVTLYIPQPESATELEVYNLLGVKILQQKIHSSLTSVQLNHQPSGMYILKIISKNNTINQLTVVKR